MHASLSHCSAGDSRRRVFLSAPGAIRRKSAAVLRLRQAPETSRPASSRPGRLNLRQALRRAGEEEPARDVRPTGATAPRHLQSLRPCRELAYVRLEMRVGEGPLRLGMEKGLAAAALGSALAAALGGCMSTGSAPEPAPRGRLVAALHHAGHARRQMGPRLLSQGRGQGAHRGRRRASSAASPM